MIAQFKNVSKVFHKQDGLHHADFNLESGQIVGLLGLNGSGKTTTFKLLSGLLKPDSGVVEVMGQDPYQARDHISYLGDKAGFYPWMNVEDVKKYMRAMYKGVDSDKFESLRDALEVPLKRTSQMSKGQQQRLRLVATMSRKARLYLLDEPLSGIDLVSRSLIIKTLIENWDETSTIVISTHEIQEIEGFFDRGIYLKQGRVVSDIQAEKLRSHKQSMTEHFIELNKSGVTL